MRNVFKFMLALRLALNLFVENSEVIKGTMWVLKLVRRRWKVSVSILSVSLLEHLLACPGTREQYSLHSRPWTSASIPPVHPYHILTRIYLLASQANQWCPGHLLTYPSCFRWLQFWRMLKEHAMVMHLGASNLGKIMGRVRGGHTHARRFNFQKWGDGKFWKLKIWSLCCCLAEL